MGSNNYNVHLSFTADTNAAKAQIKALQQELNKLATGKTLPSGITELSPEIRRATLAAGELQAKLESAVNVNTGKLDLGKFSSSLKASGRELQDYAQELSALGPEGQQAFMQMAQAVVAAETPIIRVGDKLKDLGVSIKNAAKWQISSSVIHGLWGAVESAYGYAEDLNKSLNNIRIVTGQNIEQMDKFAEKANRAAKALSATTLDYTNASLIYYQQGLTDQEVADRTAVTIKMANAAGVSAETVSDQLTAVWNNFYDGSKSLEYYADVMTALGAATASSTDEISEGLEKFASVAETVGLSYEYATAALATVTATTRQSADVVGTAFKTLFARLQDLELGDTLDDGTTLGQYSEALLKVGVDIKDTNGELKDMDNILDELGTKWDTLSKDTQIALAQTVAGTRQYTQLISLMDNWSYFQENLGVAKSSTGALQEQADIYAESWEAARDRVTASWEAIYDKLINDDAFIGLLDGLSAAIDGVGNLIDALGGLKGVLFTIGSIVTRLFQDEMSKGIYNMTQNIMSLTPNGQKTARARKEQAIEAMKSMRSSDGSLSGDAEQAAWENEIARQDWLAKNSAKLTQEQMAQVQLQNQLARQLEQRAIAATKEAEAAQKETEALMDQLSLQRKLAEVRKIRADHEDDYKKINDLTKKKEDFEASDDQESNVEYQAWRQQKMGDVAKQRIKTIEGQITSGKKPTDKLDKKKREVLAEAKIAAQQEDPGLVAGSDEYNNMVANKYVSILDDYADQGDAIAARLRDAILSGAQAGTNEYIADLDAQIKAIQAPIKAEIDAAEAKINAERAKVEEITDKAASVSANSTLLSNAAKGAKISGDTKDIAKDIKVYDQLQQKVLAVQTALGKLDNQSVVANEVAAAKRWGDALTKVQGLAAKIQAADFDPNTQDGQKALTEYEAAVQEVNQALEEMRKQEELLAGQVATKAITDGSEEMSKWGEEIAGYTEQKYRQQVKEGEADNTQRDVQNGPSPGQNLLNKDSDGLTRFASSMTTTSQAIMSVGSAISSVQGAIDVFTNPDSSGWDKLTSAITVASTVAMAFQSIMTLMQDPVSLALTAIAAAAAACFYWLSTIKTESEKATEAQKQAAEDANTAANALDEAKSSYEGLKQAIADYADAKSGLDTLIAGTEEMAEGIADANEKARELMDTYGLMGTYNAETGLWEISKEEQDRAEEASKQKVKNASAANSAAQANLKNATNYSSMAEAASRNDNNGAEIAGWATGITTGVVLAGEFAAVGATIGSAVPVLGTIIGGLVGAVAGLAVGVATYAQENEIREEENRRQIAAMDQLSANYQNTQGDYMAAYNMLSEADQALIDSLGLTSNELAQLCSEVAANTAAIRQENIAVVDNYFQDNETYANSKNKNALNNVLASEVADKQKEIFEELYKDMKDDELREAYQTAFGYKGYKEDGDGVSQYWDASANEWISMSDDMARQALAQKAALESVWGQIATLDIDLNTLNSSEATAAQKVMSVSAANGTFYDVDKNTLKELTANGQLTTDNFNAETLGISEESFEAIWRAAGFESADAYIESLNSMSGDIDNVFDSIAGKYTNSIQSVMTSLDGENNYTANQFMAIGEALNNAYSAIGNAGVEDLGKVFSAAGEDADVLIDALQNVDDWTDPNAINDLNAALEEQGINVSDLGLEWDAFCQSMVDASTNVYTLIDAFDDLRDAIASIKKITGDLSFGDTISDEDYQTLLAYNKEIANLFTMSYDGWKFVGDENVLSNMLEGSVDDLTKMKSEFEQARKTSNALALFKGWENEDGTHTIGGGYIKTDSGKALALNSFLNQDAYGDQFDSLVQASGHSRDELSEAIHAIANKTVAEDSEEYKNYMSIINDFYNTSQNFIDSLESGAFEDSRAEEVWVNSYVNSLHRLNQLVSDGTIATETFAKTLDSVFKNEADKEGFDYETLSRYADNLMKCNDELVETREEAARLALAQAKVDRGVKTLNSHLKDYAEMVSLGDLTSMDYISTLIEIEAAFTDLTGVDVSALPEGFLQGANAITLMQKAAEGDADAIIELQQLAAEQIMLSIDLDDASDGLSEKAAQAYEDAQVALAALPDLKVGMSLEDDSLQGMYQAFQDLLDSGAVTVTEMNSILSGIGFEPEIEYKKMTLGEARSLNQTSYIKTGGSYTRVTTDMKLNDDAEVWVPFINPKKTSVKAPPAPKVSSNSSGSGSTSKPEKMDYTKKSDVVERYKEVNDQLDNVADSMSKVQNIADTLWGKDHIKNLKEQNKLLDDQIALLDEEYKEAIAYQEEDAEAVRKAAEDLGLSAVVSIDEGRITNIEDVQAQMYEQLHAAEVYYNSLTTKDAQDNYKETVLEPLEKKIEAFEDAASLFDESSETASQAMLSKQEAELEKMANNFTIWTESLEIPLEINEKDIEYLEWLISRLEDDAYEMAEKGALMVGNLANGQVGGQMEKYLENLSTAEASLADLDRAYAAGEITQADYIEGLDQISDTYLDNIQSIEELDKSMQELYGETIETAMEELSKYTEQIEHSTSVLEHYKNVIELMGKSNDYEMIGTVLEGQAATAKNQMKVSKEWYETMKANAAEAAVTYAAAQARGASEVELEILKQNWDEAETAANEAQEQMLSDAEAWAEKMKEVLENKLAGFGQTLENALTGGTSFDTVISQLERASSLQEEYLTTTNQIYETNKLMRQAQQEIDKTTNSVAKKRLAAYISETEQLQNQSKLSNYELEIQQAKYNLLLAEIALQEAQDAKSTVRLQRDSEGNLGYVYTADQDKIAEAQQKLEDAQNSLYNIGLEGANNYTEKYQQLMSEMYDTLTDLQTQYLEGAFESEEEYQNRVAEAKQYYYQKLQDYSSLYQIALTTDSRVVADAWSTDFAEMTYQTDTWMQAVDTYVDQAVQAFKDWHDEVTGPEGLGDIGVEIDNVADSVQSVVDKSNELTDVTVNEVIPALDDEIDAVSNLTGSYAALRDTIIEIIDKYGLMIDTINGKKRSYWDGSDDSSSSTSSSGSDSKGESSGGSESSSASEGVANGSSLGDGLKVGDRVTVKSTATRFSASSDNQYMQSWVPGTSFEVFRVNGNQVLIGDRQRAGTYTGWVNKSDLEGFDTGGYTGEWGSYGKLAMLHQKELVLNAEDTENFLASMEVLDRILEMIDLQAASARLGGSLTSPGVRDNNQVIEQNVHIEASFPNVESHSEIEEAFNNLINQASQYANRK